MIIGIKLVFISIVGKDNKMPLLQFTAAMRHEVRFISHGSK